MFIVLLKQMHEILYPFCGNTSKEHPSANPRHTESGSNEPTARLWLPLLAAALLSFFILRLFPQIWFRYCLIFISMLQKGPSCIASKKELAFQVTGLLYELYLSFTPVKTLCN